MGFLGKEREKQLVLAAPFFYLSYGRYSTHEAMKEHFASIVSGMVREFPDVQASRFGLRFINVIEVPLDSPTVWDRYINQDLLNTVKFFDETLPLARLMHIAELNFGEINLRFQFGMPNPDFPAVIKRPQFVLDLDAYVQTAYDLTDSVRYVEQAHPVLQDLFERSITNELRRVMDAQ